MPALILAFAAAGTAAQQIYKYQDEQGRWHYTDKRPNHDYTVEEDVQTRSFEPPTALVRRDDSPAGSTLTVVNQYFVPVQVEIRLQDPESLAPGTETRLRLVAPAASETLAAELGPREGARRWGYGFEYFIMLGDPEAAHRPAQPYRVPFSLAKSFTVSQAYPDQHTHLEPSSFHAVDIAMPEGSTIHAARGGRVVDVAHSFYQSGTDLARDAQRANYVRILHEDGTMSVYAHLQWDSIRVRPGDTVTRGEYIADSGSTGFSTGPHLHFAVQRNAGMGLKAVPFQFEGAGGVAFTPQTGDEIRVF